MKDGDLCLYCGEPATGWDHVVPISMASSIPRRARRGSSDPGEKVLCCRECNAWLGAQLFSSVHGRASYIVLKLESALAKLGKSEWRDAELEEMGPLLRSSIKSSEHKFKRLERRLRWAKRHIKRWAA